MRDPFGGVRIIDCTHSLAGSMATMHLADFGAEVIKVEAPRKNSARGDAGYAMWNRNKQVVGGDLATRQGRDVLARLLPSADAAVFDQAPNTLESMGLGSDRVRDEFPGLIHLWMPPYGPDPAYANLPPSEILLQAMAGTAFSQFSWQDVPVSLVTPQLGYAHALLGAIALSAALYERAPHGVGQAVVASGFDAVAFTRSGTASPAGRFDRPPPRGTRGSSPSYRLYRCADGEWLFLGSLLMRHYSIALAALDLEGLLGLPEAAGRIERLTRPPLAALVHARMEARFLEHVRSHWLERLAGSGVPCAPVGDRTSWFESDAVRQIGMRVEIDDPVQGRLTMPGVSARLHATPGAVRHAPRPVSLEKLPHRTARDPSVPNGAELAAPPLAGHRVLDLGAIIAGPLASALLASLGAEVIKVEPPSGDSFRASGRAFLGYNQGKRSIALDLSNDRAREAFLSLVRRSDVVCDNYRLGVLERLEIDHATLSRINPRVIQASITGHGTRGPLRDEPGFDPLLQARSGLMRAQGGDDEPVFHQIPINDVASAAMLAFGIIAALHARRKTGAGQRVETSLAAQSVLTQAVECTWVAGRPPAAAVGGRDCPGARALERFYRCQDGWLAIDVRSGEAWAGLRRALGSSQSFDPVPWTQAHSAERNGSLAEQLARAFGRIPQGPLVAALLAEGVPCAPARTFQEVLAKPELIRPDLFVYRDQPGFGRMLCIDRFIHFARTPLAETRRAPMLGEHGREVLREAGVPDSVQQSLLDRSGSGARDDSSPRASAEGSR